MEFKLTTEQDRARLLGYLTGVSLEKPLQISVKPEKRSDAANRKMWAMLRDIAKQVDWHGQKLKDEDFKHIFSASVERQRAVPGLDGGFVILGLSTRNQSKQWMSDMIELMHAFGAERGVKWSAADHWQGRYDQ